MSLFKSLLVKQKKAAECAINDAVLALDELDFAVAINELNKAIAYLEGKRTVKTGPENKTNQGNNN